MNRFFAAIISLHKGKVKGLQEEVLKNSIHFGVVS